MPAQNLPGLVLDRAHPLTRGLVMWLPMNEGGGRGLRDISGNQNHGAWVGTTNTWAGGNMGRGVNLTGASGGYISVPSSTSLQVSNAMTASIWCNRTTASVNGALFHKGTLGASYGDWCLVYDGLYSTYPDFRIAYPGSGLIVGSGTRSINKWTNIVATYDKVSAKLYVDGALVHSLAYSTTIAQTATPLNIGVYYDVPYAHVGPLAHARLYSRCLDAREVAQLYADPLAGALAPSHAARYYSVAPVAPPPSVAAPLSSDRLYNRSQARIFRRGETG